MHMGVKVLLGGERRANGCGKVTLVSQWRDGHSPNRAIRAHLLPFYAGGRQRPVLSHHCSYCLLTGEKVIMCSKSVAVKECS